MPKPMIEKVSAYHRSGEAAGAYAIRVDGRTGRRWAPEGAPDGAFATFGTRAKAKHFIQDGGLIEVEHISLGYALRSAGIDPLDEFTPEASARFRAWMTENGVHYYAREKHKFFPSLAIQEAQRLGLSKLVMENLS